MYPQVPYSLSDLTFKRINRRKCSYYEDNNIYVLKSYNTIVACIDKKSQDIFIDEVRYSSYTGVHIYSVFIPMFSQTSDSRVIYISQKHLINIIERSINGNCEASIENSSLPLPFKSLYKKGDCVEFYRLHNTKGMVGQVVNHSNSWYYSNRVIMNKFNKDIVKLEKYMTPQYYNIKLCSGGKINKLYWNKCCYPRNMKPLTEGV